MLPLIPSPLKPLLLGLLVPVLALSGCGSFSDDRGVFVNPADDYLDAKQGRDLKIPADLDKDAVVDTYPIPPTPEHDNPSYYPDRPPLPDAIYGDDRAEEVRIQRIGQRRWLVVPEDATTVWPKMRQFFAENGVPIATERPKHGRVDTAWLVLGSDRPRDVVRKVLVDAMSAAPTEPVLERILIRVERGLRERTSEIHLRQVRQRDYPTSLVPVVTPLAADAVDGSMGSSDLPASAPQQLALPTPGYVENIQDLRSTSETAESELLRELGAYIAAKVAQQMVSMNATAIDTQAKSLMERDGSGAPALRLNLDFERAWATVGQALLNAEIEVLGSDKQATSFQIQVADQTFTGEEPGFLSRLFSFGDGSQEFTLQVAPAAGVTDAAYWVTVLDAEQQPPPRELAQQLLVLLREYAG